MFLHFELSTLPDSTRLANETRGQSLSAEPGYASPEWPPQWRGWRGHRSGAPGSIWATSPSCHASHISARRMKGSNAYMRGGIPVPPKASECMSSTPNIVKERQFCSRVLSLCLMAPGRLGRAGFRLG